jgi:4-amino-4-deoxy-L-arabinose transferase-like glycosyltransferase
LATTITYTQNDIFTRYAPDFLIALFNQTLFFALIASVFLLARRLFDRAVAWLSAVLLVGTELLWRFSVSGLSTMLVLLIFAGLVWCLVLFESEAREPKKGPRALAALAAIVGAAVGIGGLTRYAFGWLIIPVLVYILLFAGPRRVALALIAFAVFAGVMAPWIARNYHVSGTPFGTAGYAVLEKTFLFPENRLQRSLEPELGHIYVPVYGYKLIGGLRMIIQNDLPKLGGSWLSAFFLAGLMVGFRSPALRRLRIFLLMALGTLVIVQALGRTQLSEESPEINSENLLILLAPLVLVYGVSLFVTLLDQINLPALEFRYLIMAAGSVVACLPMIFVFLPPRPNPVSWPPYFPPIIQEVSSWVKENELTMSDVPWAMAWYGQRQSVWTTLKATPDKYDLTSRENFFAINDYMKPICVLYLTPQTMDSRFLTQWVSAGEQSWGSFILDTLVNKKVPDGFPLAKSRREWLPQQVVLADWDRWNRER